MRVLVYSSCTFRNLVFQLCETALKQRLAAAGAPETDSAQKPETQTIPSECIRNICKPILFDLLMKHLRY